METLDYCETSRSASTFYSASSAVTNSFGDFPNESLIVSDLSWHCTEKDLIKLFSSVGNVISCLICRKKSDKGTKHYGFVQMELESQAIAAVKSLHGKLLIGRNIKINRFDPKASPCKRTPSGQVHVNFKGLKSGIIVTETIIRNIFFQYGDIADVIVVQHHVNHKGLARGFGFINFLQDTSVNNSICNTKRIVVDDIEISCRLSQKKTPDSEKVENLFPQRIIPSNSVDYPQNVYLHQYGRFERYDNHNFPGYYYNQAPFYFTLAAPPSPPPPYADNLNIYIPNFERVASLNIANYRHN